MNRTVILARRASFARALGLFPFAWLFRETGSIVAFFSFVNGLFFHIFLKKNALAEVCDAVCNVSFVFYVNLYFGTIEVLLISLFALIGYLINATRFDSDLYHIFFVQFPIFLGLWYCGL